jgi:hypothetical protein
MTKPDDLSKPAVALDHDSTLVCVIEMSGTSWLVAATVPGVDRRPLQKLPVTPGAPAGAGRALAHGGGAGRSDHHAHGGGIRVRARRVLAGPAAPRTRD